MVRLLICALMPPSVARRLCASAGRQSYTDIFLSFARCVGSDQYKLVTGELEPKRLTMAAVGDMPDMARHEIAVGAWYRFLPGTRLWSAKIPV